MDISIPDSISFYTETRRGTLWEWKTYCFPHAVLRALEGEKIRTKLESERAEYCDDCKDFGDPQSYELGSLRR